MNFVKTYLNNAKQIIDQLNYDVIETMVDLLVQVREQEGRLFILGCGGSAANASHAVNDFRKLVGIESYSPTDNASELTARINDEGWDSCFSNWLKGSRLNKHDALLIFSVGGGNAEKNVSVNLIEAMKLAKEKGAKILGIVSRDGGYTAQVADASVIIPVIDGPTVTPHAEAFQAVVWHLMVSHPKLLQNAMKWSS